MVIYLNEGETQGFSSKTVVWSQPNQPCTALAWSDFDQDGYLDLALAYPNEDIGIFQLGTSSNIDYELAYEIDSDHPVVSLTWGDWSGDGVSELAVGRVNPDGNNDNTAKRSTVAVYHYSAVNQEFATTWHDSTLSHPTSLAWADWDLDNDFELIVSSGQEGGIVYENANGSPAPVSIPLPPNTSSVTWGDYDQDGDPDLAVGVDGGANEVYNNNLNP